MPLKTTEEQLIEVQDAITNLLTLGQEASQEDMRIRRAELEDLTAREELLMNRLQRERGTDISRVRFHYARS